MSFKVPFLRVLAIAAIVPSFVFSEAVIGRADFVEGLAQRQKVSESTPKRLRFGSSIYQSDRVMTDAQSKVIVRLATDNSTITIAENADVQISNLVENDGKGAFRARRIDINKGHVNFAVHKLKKNEKFEFRTGTATASIRGTEGFVGGEKVFFAGLKSGKLEIATNDGKKTAFIGAGETVFGKDSLVVVKLESSGEYGFAQKLEEILSDTNFVINEVLTKMHKADAEFQSRSQAVIDSVVSSVVPENNFSVTTTSPVDVCNDGFKVEGIYNTVDESAMLVLKLGSYTSGNLIRMTDGNPHSFAQSVQVNDVNGLWKEKKAVLSFRSSTVSRDEVFNLNVNKTCSAVNQHAPSVSFVSYDSLRCVANVAVSNMQNDVGILSTSMDGILLREETLTSNAQKRVKLKSGLHEYQFEAVDQASNRNRVTKKLGCYPMKRFSVKVFGNEKERLRVPPPPPGAVDKIMQTLKFQIHLSDNDPQNLYKVTVKQDGKVILKESLTQIQGLDYQVPVELVRDAQTRFDIEVVHKSGFVVKVKKVYEVN